MRVNKNFLFGLFTLIGTIIGAGIFGLPYVIEKSGIIAGLFYFLILGGSISLIHLFFGEIVLRTKERHRLPGFSQKYLGNWGKNLILASTIIGTSGTLLAYLILGGKFLKILLSPFLDLKELQLTLIFWLILSYFVFRGIKLVSLAELFTNLIFFLIIFAISIFCFSHFKFENLPFFNFSEPFLPFGVILFSLIGWSAIPEIADFFKISKEKRKIKELIILATFIVLLIYLSFTLTVIGVAGKKVTPDSLSSLLPFLGQKIMFLIALAAVITLADSFLVLGLYLKNTLIYDLKLSKNLAILISCFLPLFLFLIGFRNFINTIGFVGTLTGVIEGVAIVLIFKRAKILGDREPEYSLKIPSILLSFLIGIFILGAISQIIYYLK